MSASTSRGSNQPPLRREATRSAASTPRAAWKISTVCARHRIRPPSGISSPRSPSGWPWPSQCSSSARIAAAVPGPSPISRAISAPRSQRARISERVISVSWRIESSCEARVRTEAPGATVRSVHMNAVNERAQSIRLELRLATRSSTANSAAIRAELAEQPASLSSSA